MPIPVHVFEGGECVSDDNLNEIDSWSMEAAIKLIREHLGDDWPDRDCSDMFEGGEGMTLKDTVEVVSPNLIQAVKCAEDGGQYYIVRR